MGKIPKHIEIVVTNQRGLSSMSPKSRAEIQAVLIKHYEQVDITIVNELDDLVALVARQPDLVFLGLKFVANDRNLGLADPNKIWVSEFLEEWGIAYTGSRNPAVEFELNKDLAKQHLLDHGLRTSEFTVFREGSDQVCDDRELRYPLFVKPTNRGGGFGIDTGSMVHNFAQLQAKVTTLSSTTGSDALVEEYLPGREFSVGILKQLHADGYAVMPLELVAPANAAGEYFLSGKIKTADTEHHLAVTDEVLKAKLNLLALDAFQALGAQDYGRIDIRLDAAGTPHFLEANLLPSLLDNFGNFPKTCRLNLGISHETVITTIVNLAFARHAEAAESDDIEQTIPVIFTTSILGTA